MCNILEKAKWMIVPLRMRGRFFTIQQLFLLLKLSMKYIHLGHYVRSEKESR